MSNGIADNLVRSIGTPLDVESLILLNDELRGYWVSVQGTVACATENYCRFITKHTFDAIITVDWYLLPLLDKRRLVLGCPNERPCHLILNGSYGFEHDLTPTSMQLKTD
jgi:hypothetical protein